MIGEVSSVDRGAGEGVRIMLMKRFSDVGFYTSIEKGELSDEALTYLKRDFSDDKRKELASSGKALPDGSFPIENKGDLKNAVEALGRAKDPAKAKAHIKARAKALGAEDELPDSWSKRDNVIDMTGLLGRTKKAADFDEAQEAIEVRDAANDLVCQVNEAICALNDAVCSILWDADATDKGSLIAESFAQFKDYLTGLAPEGLEKVMKVEEIAKMVSDAVAKAGEASAVEMKKLQDGMAAMQLENAILKMSPEAQEFCKAMSPADKAKFAAKSKDDQDKDAAEAKKAATAVTSLPAEIQKRLDQAERDSVIVKQLQDAAEKTSFEKRATDAGLPADKGEVLRKAWKGDAEAQAEVEKLLKQAHDARDAAQKAAGLFKEFGNGGAQTGATAIDQLNNLTKEFRKTADGAKLTEAQAFDKVLNDPANTELAKQEREERMAKIHKAAA